jgi:hypothetical protein
MVGRPTLAQGEEQNFFSPPGGKLLFVWSILGKAYEGTLDFCSQLDALIGSVKSRVGDLSRASQHDGKTSQPSSLTGH